MKYWALLLLLIAGCEFPEKPPIGPPKFNRGDIITLPDAAELGIVKNSSMKDDEWQYEIMFMDNFLFYKEKEIVLYKRAVWFKEPDKKEVKAEISGQCLGGWFDGQKSGGRLYNPACIRANCPDPLHAK